MTVKDLWLTCYQWECHTTVLIHLPDVSEPIRYENIKDVIPLYRNRKVDLFWILEDGQIDILLK